MQTADFTPFAGIAGVSKLKAQCPISSDPCLESFVGMSQCSGSGSWDVCCDYVHYWEDEGCWDKDVGQLLLKSMPALLTPALLQLLGKVCGAE
jgi:hypothetical protein